MSAGNHFIFNPPPLRGDNRKRSATRAVGLVRRKNWKDYIDELDQEEIHKAWANEADAIYTLELAQRVALGWKELDEAVSEGMFDDTSDWPEMKFVELPRSTVGLTEREIEEADPLAYFGHTTFDVYVNTSGPAAALARGAYIIGSYFKIDIERLGFWVEGDLLRGDRYIVTGRIREEDDV